MKDKVDSKTNIISNQVLLDFYMPDPMLRYFRKKIPKDDDTLLKLKLCEFLKFFLLCDLTEGPIPVSQEIDDIWHFWILQTKQYQELVEKLPEKRFFHHSSNDYVQEIEAPNRNDPKELQRQVSFLASVVRNFEPFREETVVFWPMALQLLELLNVDVDGLNEYLLSLEG